ncbi:hypothetical protein PQJ75_10895 [Rhodoplanes sp. TEM]|uniref:Glycosyltransferase RgtA/B/C/D-like domain-containing protein n=1 Tax=Rhodoplanes tepidamans TaxID=200616 RepID=A0ABT5JBY7_RHOTP|nr:MULTISPECIES: hypothetical protein [Rhodoplanes]MDC7787198.1 hypothetical protein [Rhodoplanes tepidamans]MDC7984238.1 hypothetical protein [Rhodoplanes sp. TEM]MDQ0356035.1 4-amino-4-deoxy-L-arabinose transferase-like glycosyltransferase [Rhodoplanes tepidamans]
MWTTPRASADPAAVRPARPAGVFGAGGPAAEPPVLGGLWSTATARPGAAPPAGPSRLGALGWIAVAAVAAIALATAVATFLAYAAAPDALWVDVHHDRNGHFGFGLDLALALRGGDPVAFVSHLAKAVVWPPVNGLVLSGVLLVGGLDHRLAILPSLLGWSATVILTAMLARRLLDPPRTGSADPAPAAGASAAVAAAVAGALALSSPAFALLGADVMLEGLGAALSALALLCFARAMDAPADRARWRALGIVLTVLFFHKGNYWGLVLVALAVTAAIGARAPLGRLLRDALAWAAARRPGRVLAGLARDPLLIAAFVLAVAIAALYRRGPTSLDLFGRSVSLYPPENLVTVAYALVFARLAIAWIRLRPALAPRLGVPGLSILAWHVLPVAVSFLIPKRLSAFLWFIGPSNAPAGSGFDPLQGATYYAGVAATAFHASPGAAIAAAALFVAGLLGWRRWSPGGRAAFVLALVGAAGVAVHPYHQGRFLASWLFAVWIGAGAGAGLLVGLAARQAPLLLLRAGLAVGLSTTVLAAAVLWRAPPTTAVLAAANRYPGPSALALVRGAQPALAGARLIGVASTTGRTPFFAWALHVGCRCAVPVESPWLVAGAPRDAVARTVAGWLATTPADRLLVVDVPLSAQSLPEPGFLGVLDAVAAQTRFVPRARLAVPDQAATVTVWERRDAVPAPSPTPTPSPDSARRD